MKNLNKENLFRTLYKSNQDREEYLDTIPRDISPAFFDNKYTNSALVDLDMLIDYIFGNFSGSIFWFLYEWRPGCEVTFNEETAVINNIEEYIVWMKNVEGWEG
jgi:hypothetical protein